MYLYPPAERARPEPVPEGTHRQSGWSSPGASFPAPPFLRALADCWKWLWPRWPCWVAAVHPSPLCSLDLLSAEPWQRSSTCSPNRPKPILTPRCQSKKKRQMSHRHGSAQGKQENRCANTGYMAWVRQDGKRSRNSPDGEVAGGPSRQREPHA